MVSIDVWRKPYDNGVNLTKPKTIELQPGLTVLVGCNGAGKTTLLENIENELVKQKIPNHYWNNLSEGHSSSISALFGGYNEFDCDSMELGAFMFTSSEGENIFINVKRQSTLFDEFIKTGYFKDRKYQTKLLFSDDKKEKEIEDNRRFLLFDATDSGLSIDNVIDLKALFKNVIANAKENNIEMYIVISANEYELCSGENCFDITEGKYISFANYEEYKKFIINSRIKKIKRIEKQIAYLEKKEKKAIEHFENLKEKNTTRIQEIKDKAKRLNRDLLWSEKDRIRNLEREISDYAREHDIKYKP